MNDDVFSDDNDDDDSSSGAEQQPSSGAHFDQHNDVSTNKGNLPGYLMEALEKYVKEFGYGNRNKKIPFSALVISELSNISRQIYSPHHHSNALAAMWKVLNQATEGQLELEFRKIELEEKIVQYDYLSTLINRIYAEIEEHIDEAGFEETTRLGRMLMVYFDLLNYHHQYFLDEYLEFCQVNTFEPDENVIEHKGYDHSYPELLGNVLLYRVLNADSDPAKGSLVAYFNELIENVAKYARNQVVTYDKINLEKE